MYSYIPLPARLLRSLADGLRGFDKEAQKKAFELTYNKIMNVLTEDAKEYLTTIYGDLEIYITTKIESEVKLYKEA